MSIGTAISNAIRVDSKCLRPIQAIFFEEDSCLKFQELWPRSVTTKRLGERWQLGDIELEILNEAQLVEKYQHEISLLYKRTRLENSRVEALERVSRSYFEGRSLPQLLESYLDKEWGEQELKGPIEVYLMDPRVSDVLALSWDEIWVEKDGRLERSPNQFNHPKSYRLYIENLLKKHGQTLDEYEAVIDFEIQNPSCRFHIVGPPISGQTYYLSIRKHFGSSKSLKDLKDLGMLDEESDRFLRDCIRRRKSLLIAGSTGSGKTTLLSALLQEIPPNERLVVIEDTPEIAPQRVNTCFLRTHLKNPGSNLRALIRQSLRMRPDRIIIGESRGAEAWDLLMALNTGHRGSMSSLHANSARDALWRFFSLLHLSEVELGEDDYRELICRNLDAVVFCEKDAHGRRRVTEIVELKGREGSQFLAADRYLWKERA